MSAYESAVLARFGYSSARGCGKARLCPAFSLPDLFSGQVATAARRHRRSSPQAQVSGLLGAIPPYFSQDVITPDRRVATLAFGIRLMGLDQQQQLIEAMRSSLHPPAGVSAQPRRPAGAGGRSRARRSPIRGGAWRRCSPASRRSRWCCCVAFRGDRRRALVPLAPIVLATGWSALILFAVRVPLNPMSVTLGALVIAISTEFSVLLVRAPPPGAPGRATTRSRRCAAATGARAPRSPPRG